MNGQDLQLAVTGSAFVVACVQIHVQLEQHTEREREFLFQTGCRSGAMFRQRAPATNWSIWLKAAAG